MKNKMKTYPKEIRNRVKQICGKSYRKRFDIDEQFDWEKSEEGSDFWVDIYFGNYDVFYEKYPEELIVDITVNGHEIVAPKDTVVESVINQFKERSEVGFKKYGTNLDRKDLNVLEWMQHLQEELMDACLYVEKLKKEVWVRKNTK